MKVSEMKVIQFLMLLLSSLFCQHLLLVSCIVFLLTNAFTPFTLLLTDSKSRRNASIYPSYSHSIRASK